jgi:hypothetical protein
VQAGRQDAAAYKALIGALAEHDDTARRALAEGAADARPLDVTGMLLNF